MGAQEAVRRGFTGFKWSPFDADMLRTNEARAIAHAAELMAAAREGAGPDTEIFIECAERLSPRSAVLAARALVPYRPGWFEDPIPFENAKAMVQLQLSAPIATGERLLSRWEVRTLLEEGGCTILQPDVLHAGGITDQADRRVCRYLLCSDRAAQSRRPDLHVGGNAPRGGHPKLLHP